MKLSVIVPVYNAEKYLNDCVGSLLDQTRAADEIILVDDGSKEVCRELCDQLEAAHAAVKVIHQENGGASSARNTGLKAATGDFVHFVDSDDLLPDEKVYETIVPLLTDEIDILFSRRIRFQDGSDEIDAIQPEYREDGLVEGDILKLMLTRRYGLTLTCPVNKIFNRSFLIDNDLFFTEGLDHEEDEWLPRVFCCAKTVWFDNATFLYKVRVRDGSLSAINTDEKRADKACSKVRIAAGGMAYMQRKHLSDETLSLSAEYYWEYLTDACAACRTLSKEGQRRVKNTLKEHKAFFSTGSLLKSRNKRLMARLFRVLGINLTVRIIGIRYGTAT